MEEEEEEERERERENHTKTCPDDQRLHALVLENSLCMFQLTNMPKHENKSNYRETSLVRHIHYNRNLPLIINRGKL